MTKYILIFLTLTTFIFPQEQHFKGTVKIDTLRATVSYADSAFSEAYANAVPISTDRILVETSGGMKNATLADLPVSIHTTDAIDDAVTGAGSNEDILVLQTDLVNLQAEFDAYKIATDARLSALENEIVVPDPTAPTNLVATAHASLIQITVTWDATATSLCDSVYLYRQLTTGDAIPTIIARVDSGVGTYTNTGLNEATGYTYQAKTVKYINGVAKLSNFSNTASATTTVSDPPVFAYSDELNEDWEQGNLDSAYAITDGVSTDGTIALGIVGAISGNYSMYSRVDSALGYAYAWYKLPTPLADADTLWIRFDIRPDYLTGIGEAANFKTIFALGDTVSSAFRSALKLSLRKQTNDDGLYQVRMTNNNNTLNSTSVALDSVIELNTSARILIGIQTGTDSADNFVKLYVSDYNTGLMTQTYASDPFTTLNSSTYIESEYLRLGLENITTSLGDKFSYDNLVAASDSAGLFATVDTTGGSGDSTSVYESVLFVSAGATGTGDGTQLNPYTLAQARTIAVAGDTIIVEAGAYNATTGISFSNNGTSALPIVWIGTLATGDLDFENNYVTGDSSTVIWANSSSNVRITMSGAYNEFHDIAFRQDYDQRQLISISGNGVKWDGCTFKNALTNSESSSNHSIVVTGVNVTISNSTFWGGARTCIWVRKNSGTQGDYFTLEGSKFTKAKNHPAIQIMPATNFADTITVKRPIVRNTLFYENRYSSSYHCIYLRGTEQHAIYNNVFYASGGVNIEFITGLTYPTGAITDTLNSKGGIIAYNTRIEDTDVNIMYNGGLNQVYWMNNIFYSTYTFTTNITNLKFPERWNAIRRHKSDYNHYYFSAMSSPFTSYQKIRGSWGLVSTSVWWADWFTTTGLEENTTVDVNPNFSSLANFISTKNPIHLEPSNAGTGQPITTANGYWMNITTDYFGTTRNVTTPTAGAVEYVP